MSQHDLDIANQGFPATRADINNALQALGSSNSGATAPSTTYANQLWYDTANNILKIRNEDNDAWISLFTLDQTSDNIEALTVNGTITADALTVDTNTLYVDATNNRLGVGTVSPSEEMHLYAGSGATDLLIEQGSTGNAYLHTKNSNREYVVGTGGDALRFIDLTADAERMRITSDGSIGIGTASPSGNLNISDSTSAQLNINSGATGFTRQILFSTGTNTQEAKISSDNATGELRFEAGRSVTSSYIQTFYTNGAERMRIDSSGYLLVGQNTNDGPGQGNSIYGLSLRGDGRVFASADGTYSLGLNRSDSGELTNFARAGSFKGSISINASSVSYNTTSDHRLKQNVVDMTGAIDRVKALAPKRFDFISDAGNTVDGFLAHEAQAVVPEAVTGTKDAMRDEEYEVTPAVLDDDGNVVTEAVMGTRSVPEYQGIDQSKLVPLLTGALQEAVAKIESLETRIAALEA